MTFARRSEETLEIRNRISSQPIRHQYGAWFSLDCRYQNYGESQNLGSEFTCPLRFAARAVRACWPLLYSMCGCPFYPQVRASFCATPGTLFPSSAIGREIPNLFVLASSVVRFSTVSP